MTVLPFWVDLHIHTVLSPCGELEMGAPDIAEACRRAGVALCAITDHNASDNARAVAEAAGGYPLVLPGIEVQTAEDIHLVTVFPSPEDAAEFQKWLWKRMGKVENRPEIFGEQLIIDKGNQIIGEQEILLVQGVGYTADETAAEAMSRGAIVILAHLDRPSFSYEAVLGPVPDDFPCHAFELSSSVSHEGFSEWRDRYPGRVFIRSSDSHRLFDISRARCTVMMMKAPAFEEVKMALMGLEGRSVICPWGEGPLSGRESSDG